MVGNRFMLRMTSVVRWIIASPALFLLVAIPGPTTGAANDDLHLPASTFPEAVEAWRSAQVADAVATLDRQLAPDAGDQPIEALILRATLYAENRQPLEAEALWHTIIEREIWMRTFARRALVKSLTGRRTPEAAETILNALNDSDRTRHLDLTLDVADAYVELGQSGPARRLYRLVAERQPRSARADAARLGLATTLESEGDVAAALVQLRDAKRRHRTGRAYETADRAERRLIEAHGLSVSPWRQSDYRALVRRLRGASRFDATLALIDEWRAALAPPSGDPAIELEWITTRYAQRANDQAVAAIQAFYERFPKDRLLPDIRLTDFRLAVRMGNTERARQSGLDLWEGRVPGATEDHRWNAGNLLAAHLVAVGDLDGGLRLYRELFRSTRSPDTQRELLWRAGIAALRAGQHERALDNLRALMDRRPTGNLVPAGLYWLAKAESHGNPAAATRRLRDVAGRFPYHYYGMRARQELGRPGGVAVSLEVDPTVTFPDLTLDQGTRERPEFRAAMALARAGLVTDAAWYLRRLLARRSSDRGLALLTARASADAGDQASVTRILVNHFGVFLQRPADRLPQDFWELVYPRPYWDDVNKAATADGVDPFLMLSVMRRESRFDPNALSPVGAVGLFQIMPYTAEALADDAGVGQILIGGLDEQSLTDPFVNAAIAARLTSDLLEMFDGATAPTVASYNAGEERVAGWWDAARHLTEDFFVDTIPYSETRRFVREVLANRAAYTRIYGE